MKKKILSLLVAMCMIIGMLPMIAIADSVDSPYAVMDFTSTYGGDNCVLVPDEAAYFKVTAPDADGNTYLTKDGASESDYDVAYIYEEVPTLYLNGANIQNDLPFVLYACNADTEKVQTDLKIVIEADTVIHSTSNRGGADSIYTGFGAAIALLTTGGEATITSIGDAKLTVSAINPDEYSPLAGTSGQRGSVILASGDLTLKDANIDVDFSKNENSSEFAPSGISADGGDLIIDGGNIRVGLGLRSDVTEMRWPLQLVSRDSVGGSLEIKNGANVLIMQDNDARCFRYDGSVTISDSNVELVSTASTGRPAFHSAAPTFNYTVDYTVVAGGLPTIVDNAPVAPSDVAEIDLATVENIKAYNYFKITVDADDEGGEGDEGGEEVINYDSFYLEYWNGSGWDYAIVAPGENALFTQSEADSNGYSHLVAVEDAEDYVVKIDYPADGEVTIYFKGLNMTNPGNMALLFERDGSDSNGWVFGSNINLVIEEDSSITIDGEGWYGAIDSYCSATTTISSANGAKLTLSGKDSSSDGRNGTIWARGDLVLDGAVLEVTAAGGSSAGVVDYGIGADGDITITDSNVKITANGAAFNKAPVIDEELSVVAATTAYPTKADLVEYIEADVATYKYVKIAPVVNDDEGGNEGGEDDVPVYGNAALEYRFDEGDNGYDVCVLVQGEGAVYFVTTEADEDGINYLTTEGATEDNYNLKFEYLEGEAATLYFKDLNLKNDDPFRIYNADDVECPFVIVVESESWIETTDCDYGSFEIDTNAPVTITSVDNAQLTLVGAHFAGIDAAGNMLPTPGVLNATNDLHLIDANVVIGYNLVWPGSTGVGLVGGDLYIHNSSLLVGMGLHDGITDNGVDIPSWNDVTYSFYMMADSQGNGGNIYITEGSNVFAMGDQAYNVVHTDGDTYISDSTFEAGTEWSNTSVFEKAPILEFEGEYEVSVTKTAPALNKEEMKLRPSKNGFVDYNEDDIQKYMYFKITHIVVVANGTCGENLTWKLDEEGTLTISGTGDMADYSDYTEVPWRSHFRDITTVVIADGVSSIGNCAFSNYPWLTSVTISNSVTSIGRSAFAGCGSLTSITIPESVTSIEKSAFYYCYQLEEITIPDGVTNIGESTFEDCYSLTSITIPDSITSIDRYAFRNCSSLTDVYFDGPAAKWANINMNATGNDPLLNATIHTIEFHLVDITIKTQPNKTEYLVGESLDTTGLTLTATYSDGSTMEITEGFIVSSFDSTTIGEKVVTVTYEGLTATFNVAVVYGGTCGENLTWTLNEEGTLTISGTGDMADYSDYTEAPWRSHFRNITAVVIADGVSSIGNCVFSNYPWLTSVTISNSVTSIGRSAFASCGSLTNITIPESVTSIEKSAFYYCYQLEEIAIPHGVTNIGESTFEDCYSLTSITIPDSITSIDRYAFRNCSSLTDVYFDGTAAQWANINMNATGNDPLLNATIHTIELHLVDITIKTQPNKTEYWVGESLDTTGLTLTATYSDGSTKEIAEDFTVSGFDFATAGEQTITVSYEGFTTTFTVTVTLGGTCGENLTWTLDEKGTLTVSGTGKMTDYYESSVPWDTHKNNIKSIVIEDGVTSIGGYAFPDCTSLISVTIPDSVTLIGNGAFDGCTGLTSITIPDSITFIGAWAFSRCTGLTSITIPVNIELGTFSDCTSLTSVTIGNGVIGIGDYVFGNCTALTSITIPDSVTSIGYDAFRNCSSLTDVYYGGTAAQWANINIIAAGNNPLLNATIHAKPAYKFGNTVTCNETLDLNFYLPKDAVPMAATWIVTYGGNVLEEGEYSLDLQSDGRMRVRVSYYPHQLNNEVTVICKDANGVVLAERSNSIQGYCMTYLGLATGQPLDRALMVAMLEYGSLAQLGVAGGDAAAAGPLANRDLTAAHRAYLTGYAWPTSGTPTAFAENNKTLPYTFSTSVTCNETLDLNFYLNANATDKAASWIVTINGEEVSEDKYIISKDASNRWRVRVPFLANQMNSLVSVTAKDAEGNVIAQRSNSIREYAMLYLDLSTATALDSALMVAMLEFGSLAQIGLNQTDVLANYLLNDTYRANLTLYAWPN